MADVKPAPTKLQPKNGFKKFLWRMFFILFLSGGLVFWWHYYWVYNRATTDGVLVKFSQRGNMFKTYEGEIVQPGLRSNKGSTVVNTNNFFFSVTDKKIADSLGKVTGKNVRVSYHQFYGSLPWRGDYYNGQNSEDGQFIVDSILSVSESTNIGF